MAQTAALKDIGRLYAWTATLCLTASSPLLKAGKTPRAEVPLKWVEPLSGTSGVSPCIWIKRVERGRSRAVGIEFFKMKRGKGPKIKTPSVSGAEGAPGGAEQSQQIELHTHANKLTQRCIQRGPGGRSGHTVRALTHQWSTECLFVPNASRGHCMIWDSRI